MKKPGTALVDFFSFFTNHRKKLSKRNRFSLVNECYLELYKNTYQLPTVRVAEGWDPGIKDPFYLTPPLEILEERN